MTQQPIQVHWEAAPQDSEGVCIFDGPSDNAQLVARVYDVDNAETADHARLIAAAPALLAALGAAPDFGGDPTTAFGREYREWQIIQRAAIAKVCQQTQ